MQWSINRVGEKLQQLDIHDGATGPFVMSGFGGYKQQQAPQAKLFAFDSTGTHVLTCAPYGGIIYKVNICIELNSFMIWSRHVIIFYST